jgi:hypothetical protein
MPSGGRGGDSIEFHASTLIPSPPHPAHRLLAQRERIAHTTICATTRRLLESQN